MNKEIEIKNAVIKSANWDRERGLTHWIIVEGDGWGCGFGGYYLKGIAASIWIETLMDTLELDRFNDNVLIGMVIRVKTEGWGGGIEAIGHPYKEKWMNPKELFANLKE